MSKNKEKVDRRKFLKMSAVGAAGGAAVIASKSVSAETKSFSNTNNFWLNKVPWAYFFYISLY